MAALTAGRNVSQMGQDPIPGLYDFPVAANVHIYPGAGLVVQGGYARPAFTATGLVSLGRADKEADNTIGLATNGAITVRVKIGAFYFKNSAGADAIAQANVFSNVAYWVDDNTVALTDGGGTRSVAGPIVGLDATLGVCVALTGPFAGALAPVNPEQFAAGKARLVATAIPAYTGSGTGVLTGSVNGALAVQDGVALAVGDSLFVPAGLANVAAKDSGPWTVTNAGAVGAKYVLTRPSWWFTGSAIVPADIIDIGGEGTNFHGYQFKAMCGKSQLIDTNDPMFYARTFKKTIALAAGTYTLGAGGGLEQFGLFDTTTSTVTISQNTPVGTANTTVYCAVSASRIAGYTGTAAVVLRANIAAGTINVADTSTLDVVVTNYLPPARSGEHRPERAPLPRLSPRRAAPPQHPNRRRNARARLAAKDTQWKLHRPVSLACSPGIR